MPRIGTVNYHVRSPKRQAYHIDASGVAGKLLSPEHAVTAVMVKDVRRGEARVSFDEDGISFQRVPTSVRSFTADDGWAPDYERELAALLSREVGAKEVVAFDHTIRTDDPDAVRAPARNVHGDYSPAGAHQRLIDILGADTAEAWSEGHYAFINVWRPIGAPVHSAPLGLVRPSSVEDEDWIPIDLVYGDGGRKGHIMGLVASDGHEWIYASRMTPEEVVFFNTYDNRGRPSIAHSALDLVELDAAHSVRTSIESRTLVRY